MIPRLYDAATNTSGLSAEGTILSDVISCIVTEERNGAFELKMVISKDDQRFSQIEIGKILMAKPNETDDDQPFRIYRITKPLNGKVTVYGEHISNRLSHIPVGIFSVENATAQQAMNALKSHALTACPFTFKSDVATVTKYSVNVPAALKSKLVGTTGSILQIYGGEYKYDKYKVSLLAERGEDTGITLRYGENITNITQENAMTNVYTGICPYWKGQDENSQDVVVTATGDVVYASDHADFPYERIQVIDFAQKIDHIPTASELKTAAESYIAANKISEPNTTFDVAFVPVWQAVGEEKLTEIASVSLCDIVNVYYPSIGISAKAKVIKTEYNVLTERYNKITIGTTKTSFTERLASDIISAASSGGGTSGSQVTQARILKVVISNFSTLPQTVNHSAITSKHEVIHADFTNPDAQSEDWTVTTSAGSLTVSGSITSATTLTLYLTEPAS